MTSLVLIDTSVWTQALRRSGRADTRARVEALLRDKRAAWCDVNRLELWKGSSNDDERRDLALLESRLSRLPITDQIWDEACSLGLRARKNGLNVPTSDLIIFACATVHAVAIEHLDHHFDLLRQLP